MGRLLSVSRLRPSRPRAGGAASPLLTVLLGAARCASAGDDGSAERPPRLCADPARTAGTTVVLTGEFRGYRVAECPFALCASRRGATRGDWLFKTDEGCFYVTGGVPQGIDTIDPQHVGRRLEVKVRPTRTDEGRLLLTYLEGHLLDR